MKIRGLYIITDSTLSGQRLLNAVEQALKGGATIVQYRQKDKRASAYVHDAGELRKLTARYETVLIINDSPELAREVDADGVHIGRSDMSMSRARTIVGQEKIVGVSCYNDITRARRAQQQGADYVAFGSFFVSSVKPNAAIASIELLREAKSELSIPIVAIGGINQQNGEVLIDAGADSIAVISAVFAQTDIKTAAQQLTNLFN